MANMIHDNDSILHICSRQSKVMRALKTLTLAAHRNSAHAAVAAVVVVWLLFFYIRFLLLLLPSRHCFKLLLVRRCCT